MSLRTNDDDVVVISLRRSSRRGAGRRPPRRSLLRAFEAGMGEEQNRSDPNQESTRLSNMLSTGDFPDEPSVEGRPSLGLQQLVSSPRLGEGAV